LYIVIPNPKVLIEIFPSKFQFSSVKRHAPTEGKIETKARGLLAHYFWLFDPWQSYSITVP